MVGQDKLTIKGVKIGGEFYTMQEARLLEAFKTLKSNDAERADMKMKAARLKGAAALTAPSPSSS